MREYIWWFSEMEAAVLHSCGADNAKENGRIRPIRGLSSSVNGRFQFQILSFSFKVGK